MNTNKTHWWPSGLRRYVQVVVYYVGAGSNPAQPIADDATPSPGGRVAAWMHPVLRRGDHHATLPPPGSEERKQALEEWFSKAVLPTLRKGLINVCEKQPGDPIDHLAAFLFKHGGDVPSGMEVPHAHTHGVSSAAATAAESKE